MSKERTEHGAGPSVAVVIPHSHSYFWTQSCVAALKRNPPHVKDGTVTIIVVDNSPWSPAIRGITDTSLGEGLVVIPNHKNNRFHASALDCVVEDYHFDYLMAFETDVLALKPGWLQWFINEMRDTDYAVGMWHHEKFVNPSCTLYRFDVLRKMHKWCKNHPDPDALRWGPDFSTASPLDESVRAAEHPAEVLRGMKNWIAGPFAEKRGWPSGTILKEAPSGMLKGPGWYEPGQQLHHWAVQEGHTYTVCPTLTTHVNNTPVQTVYGAWGTLELGVSCPPSGRPAIGFEAADPRRQLEAVELFGLSSIIPDSYTAHLWGGTRALDILKHEVTCEFVRSHTPGWLAREARFWRHCVPMGIRNQTIDLIQRYGWHITGQGSDHVTERDKAAAAFVKGCYEAGGVTW